MSLNNKEQRQIFYQLLQSLCEALEEKEPLELYSQGIYDVLRSVVAEETAEGKVKSYVDNFIYLPKCALVALIEKGEIVLSETQKEKFWQSKPKFSKLFFNEILLKP